MSSLSTFFDLNRRCHPPTFTGSSEQEDARRIINKATRSENNGERATHRLAQAYVTVCEYAKAAKQYDQIIFHFKKGTPTRWHDAALNYFRAGQYSDSYSRASDGLRSRNLTQTKSNELHLLAAKSAWALHQRYPSQKNVDSALNHLNQVLNVQRNKRDAKDLKKEVEKEAKRLEEEREKESVRVSTIVHSYQTNSSDPSSHTFFYTAVPHNQPPSFQPVAEYPQRNPAESEDVSVSTTQKSIGSSSDESPQTVPPYSTTPSSIEEDEFDPTFWANPVQPMNGLQDHLDGPEHSSFTSLQVDHEDSQFTEFLPQDTPPEFESENQPFTGFPQLIDGKYQSFASLRSVPNEEIGVEEFVYKNPDSPPSGYVFDPSGCIQQ